MRSHCCLLLWLATLPLAGQFEPESAHVNLYFPQIADGGPAGAQWRTALHFVNPHPSSTAEVTLNLWGDNGQPASFDFGGGPRSSVFFTIPPNGSRIFRSAGTAATATAGWAMASCSIPVQATALMQSYQGDLLQTQVAAEPVLPTLSFRSIATRSTGIAVANAFAGLPVQVRVRAFNADGNAAGTGTVSLTPRGHSSFTLGTLIPGLPPDFWGSVEIEPAAAPLSFIAWTVDSTGGRLASLPGGALSWPVSQTDRFQLVYRKLLNAARAELAPFGVNFADPPLALSIESGAQEINAYATGDGREIVVTMSLAELLGDSPGELAFVVAHEMAHAAQTRLGRNLIVRNNFEIDADQVGLLLNLAAGFDPYAGSGALAKLAMASNSAGLVEQALAEDFDIHRSLNTRIETMFSTLVSLCSDPSLDRFCTEYRNFIHPHFPPSVPLGQGPMKAAR